MKIITSREELKGYLGSEVEHLLFNIYDGFVRVVDPEKNRVEITTPDLIGMQNNSESSCFEIWHKNKVCSNCTSLRAIINNETISKMESKDDLVYLVHSLPFYLPDGRKVVLEVIKNLTNVPVNSGIHDYPDLDFITLLRSVDRLNKRVYRDALTNAFNREYLIVKLSSTITRGNCTILMVDIDNFKRINDKYGHPAGDAVLRKCVSVIGSKLRENDEIIRYAGDEFIIVLNNISKKEAKHILTRLEQAVKDNPVEYENESISYEVSIGSYTVEDQGLDLSEIIKRADESMYEVKIGKKCTKILLNDGNINDNKTG